MTPPTPPNIKTVTLDCFVEIYRLLISSRLIRNLAIGAQRLSAENFSIDHQKNRLELGFEIFFLFCFFLTDYEKALDLRTCAILYCNSGGANVS